MLKIRAEWYGKCYRHPGYNPAKEGEGGIKGNCDTCRSLYERYQKLFLLVRNSDGRMLRQPGKVKAGR
jgi:hypothetical protein